MQDEMILAAEEFYQSLGENRILNIKNEIVQNERREFVNLFIYIKKNYYGAISNSC